MGTIWHLRRCRKGVGHMRVKICLYTKAQMFRCRILPSQSRQSQDIICAPRDHAKRHMKFVARRLILLVGWVASFLLNALLSCGRSKCDLVATVVTRAWRQ